MAVGGQISGPGTGTSDSIPIMASHGEFIVNAASAKKFAPVLEAINAGRLRGFAEGGTVTAMQPMPSAVAARGSSGLTSVVHAPVFNITPAQGVTPAQLTATLKTYDEQSQRTLLSQLDTSKNPRFAALGMIEGTCAWRDGVIGGRSRSVGAPKCSFQAAA